ncbi:MAG: hypothetical protein MZV70_63445 [Desulfobacterales bacterium]|nr:hypothetical protein [Desulfobacterales bacterium]
MQWIAEPDEPRHPALRGRAAHAPARGRRAPAELPRDPPCALLRCARQTAGRVRHADQHGGRTERRADAGGARPGRCRGAVRGGRGWRRRARNAADARAAAGARHPPRRRVRVPLRRTTQPECARDRLPRSRHRHRLLPPGVHAQRAARQRPDRRAAADRAVRRALAGAPLARAAHRAAGTARAPGARRHQRHGGAPHRARRDRGDQRGRAAVAAPGRSRSAHRAAEPRLLHKVAGAGAPAPAAIRRVQRALFHRSRPVQIHQRHPRPRRRRPAAGAGGAGPAPPAAGGRPACALRRRRVHGTGARRDGRPGARGLAAGINHAVNEARILERGTVCSTGASVGVALLGGDSYTVEELLAQADMACYAAKAFGRNNYRLYEPQDAERLRMGADFRQSQLLKAALRDGLLSLHYQPMIGLRHGERPYYEALLRMPGEDAEPGAAGELPAGGPALRPAGRDRPLGDRARARLARRRAAPGARHRHLGQPLRAQLFRPGDVRVHPRAAGPQRPAGRRGDVRSNRADRGAPPRARRPADARAARLRLPHRARRFRGGFQLVRLPAAPAGGFRQDRRGVRAQYGRRPSRSGDGARDRRRRAHPREAHGGRVRAGQADRGAAAPLGRGLRAGALHRPAVAGIRAAGACAGAAAQLGKLDKRPDPTEKAESAPNGAWLRAVTKSM